LYKINNDFIYIKAKDSEDSGLAQSTQKPRRTNLLEEQRKQLIIQIEQKNKKSIGNYDDNLTPMTANSAFSIYNSHSPLKQRMSISASSNAGNNSFVNNGNEEAETLEEEEIWPIMEGKLIFFFFFFFFKKKRIYIYIYILYKFISLLLLLLILNIEYNK